MVATINHQGLKILSNQTYTRIITAAIAAITAISLGAPAADAAETANNAAARTGAAPTQVTINATNFPDANLRQAVAANDRNKDGKLSGGELTNPTLNLRDGNGDTIANDLTGIGLLVNLKTLIIGAGYIKNVDLTRNTALTTLDITNNDLTTLDLSANTNLVSVQADANQLRTLTLPKAAPRLRYLSAERNRLTTLDLSGLTALNAAWAGYNQLATLTLPKGTVLQTVGADHNKLTTLDLSGRTGLHSLFLSNNAFATIDLRNLPNLTRAELANNRIVTRPVSSGSPKLATLLLDGNPYSRFHDVNDATPHADDIRWLGARGIAGGYADGSFGGMRTVVRQDMAAFLYRLAGSPKYTPSAADKARFRDVNSDTPHAKEIWWLASTGIAKGYPDGTFGGMRTVVRQDMAAFLHRYAAWAKANPKLGEDETFKDVNTASPASHASDIVWLSRTGVTSGYPDGTFGGMRDVVRQDMAAFLHRMSTNVLK